MTILNYILHIAFVGVQKTSTNNSYPSTKSLGGRGFSAFIYANTLHPNACKDIWNFPLSLIRTLI